MGSRLLDKSLITTMSCKCQICGRPLSSPASIAAGVGPVCGGRSYTNRVKGRHASFSGGWKDLNAWETVNHPCYSCKWFKVPPKDGEVSYVDRVSGQVCYLARMKKSDPWTRFPPLSIGGHCSQMEQMVDGNQINAATACGGEHYVARKDKSEKPRQGELVTPNGTVTLDLSHPEL